MGASITMETKPDNKPDTDEETDVPATITEEDIKAAVEEETGRIKNVLKTARDFTQALMENGRVLSSLGEFANSGSIETETERSAIIDEIANYVIPYADETVSEIFEVAVTSKRIEQLLEYVSVAPLGMILVNPETHGVYLTEQYNVYDKRKHGIYHKIAEKVYNPLTRRTYNPKQSVVVDKKRLEELEKIESTCSDYVGMIDNQQFERYRDFYNRYRNILETYIERSQIHHKLEGSFRERNERIDKRLAAHDLDALSFYKARRTSDQYIERLTEAIKIRMSTKVVVDGKPSYIGVWFKTNQLPYALVFDVGIFRLSDNVEVFRTDIHIDEYILEQITIAEGHIEPEMADKIATNLKERVQVLAKSELSDICF
tara:strand:+ start:137 stop:1255 length:1119 start_codon:yes stop_codon:yes gene_type:complete